MNDDDLRRAGFVPVGKIADDQPLEVRDEFLPSWGWRAHGQSGDVVAVQGVAGPAGAHIEPPPPVPPPVVVFRGRPKVYFLAVCVECNEGRRPAPMPFGTEADRDRWADGHRTTGHTVNEAVEVRP